MTEHNVSTQAAGGGRNRATLADAARLARNSARVGAKILTSALDGVASDAQALQTDVATLLMATKALGTIEEVAQISEANDLLARASDLITLATGTINRRASEPDEVKS